MANQAMNYLVSGKAPRRNGNAHPNIVPYQGFPAADGAAPALDDVDAVLVELAAEAEQVFRLILQVGVEGGDQGASGGVGGARFVNLSVDTGSTLASPPDTLRVETLRCIVLTNGLSRQASSITSRSLRAPETAAITRSSATACVSASWSAASFASVGIR